ncbi:helix-turn-helix domain-containing protein [Streptomyces sp. or20]|uniref:helix-turn-helix domain-containing protein n=1 Tax=Streptomyces sp. or20 TaxID=1828016 RepID=UPI000BF20433|nr:helix-turn-helix domain-containing protein [Streptomyces sp. or20]
MTPKAYKAVSVRQLAAVVDDMAGTVSEGRVRQLRMVVDMFDRAVGREEMPDPAARSADQLFTWAALSPFWELAAAGELRHWEKDIGKPLPVTTLRVVRNCLEMLAERVLPAGRSVRLPELEVPELKPTVDDRSLTALYRGMVDLAAQGPLVRDGTALSVEDRTRLLAMVAVLLDAAPRSGEMATQTLADLAPGEAAVGVRRRAQRLDEYRVGEVAAATGVHPVTVTKVLSGLGNDRFSEATEARVLEAAAALPPVPEVEWFELREGSRVAVRRWLVLRERLVSEDVPLTGQRTALWVTLTPSKAGPIGIPLRAQGLRQAYARGITALNWVMAGQYGWEPFPTTMEQVRRSVDVVPLLDPPV